jgi:hypothetical protein
MLRFRSLSVVYARDPLFISHFYAAVASCAAVDVRSGRLRGSLSNQIQDCGCRNGRAEWSSPMSLITYARTSPVRPQTSLVVRRIAARIPGLARSSFGSLKPHIETVATILLFTAIMAVLLGVKAAVMLSRMPNLGQ